MTQSRQITNPYIAGNPVTGQDMFFGREDVFEFVRRALIGQHQNNIIVLYGQRRTGKTSVLYQMHRNIDSQYIPVLIDLQALSMEGMATFLWEIAATITRALQRDQGVTVERPAQEEFVSNPREFFQDVFLSRVFEALGDRHLLLMIDESIRLEDQVLAARLESDIFDYLRHLMQHNTRLDFIFSMGTALEEARPDYAVLFNVALYKKISFLTPEDSRTLVAEPVKDVLSYDDAAIDLILKTSGGHAYYTQLICHSLFARWERTGSDRIGTEDVLAVLPEVIERGLANLKFVWDQATVVGKLSLTAMASIMGEENRAVTERQIQQTLRASQIQLPLQTIERALGELVSTEAVVPEGGYRFSTDLLRLYLVQQQRMEWVQEGLREALEELRQAGEIGAESRGRRGLGLALSIGVAAILVGALVGALAIPASPWSLTSSPSVPPPAGTYIFERCGIPPIGGDDRVRLRLCVESVDVDTDGAMKFTISWRAEIEEGLVLDGLRVTQLVKSSDAGKTNMYITDDRGNRYDFTDLGDAATGETTIPNGEKAEGWFLFPPPQGGARLFTFHDDDNFWAISGILLE